jgi:hypothetical protein
MLPASFVVYFIMSLALWRDPPQEEVLRIVFECLTLIHPEYDSLDLPTKSAIFKARLRLGPDVMYEVAKMVMKPIALPNAPGAWFHGLRLMSLDGTTFDVPDSQQNASYFGYPSSSRAVTAFPQIRLLGLAETGTHVLVAAEVGPYKCTEQELTARMIDNGGFTPEMLILADRNFYGYRLWKKASETGASLLWRTKTNLILPVEKRLPDNSFLSTVYDSKDRNNCDPLRVRVVEYKLKGENTPDKDNIYRILTNMFDYKQTPAKELAALYHERWEIESIFSEIKVSLKGNSTIIRSKIPDLVHQDIWGAVTIHFAVRQLMSQAAWQRKIDPDKLSFMKAVHVLRRKLPQAAVFPHLER